MDHIVVHPAYFPSIAQMTAIVNAQKVTFEIHDNYQKQTYRNRAYIAHTNGRLLLNVPIKHSKNGDRQKTREVVPEDNFPWQAQHWKSLQTAYRTSPFFEYYEDDLAPLFNDRVDNLLDHNIKIFDLLCELMGVEVAYNYTSEYQMQIESGDLRHLIVAKNTKEYNLSPYTQVLEAQHGFLSNLSILDLLFNEGPNSLQYLEGQSLEF